MEIAQKVNEVNTKAVVQRKREAFTICVLILAVLTFVLKLAELAERDMDIKWLIVRLSVQALMILCLALTLLFVRGGVCILHNLGEYCFGLLVMLTLAPIPFDSNLHILEFASNLITSTCLVLMLLAQWRNEQTYTAMLVILWSHILIWT